MASIGWNTINLTEPYFINASQDLWIFIQNTETFDDLRLYLCQAEGAEGVYYSQNPTSYTYNNASGYAFLIKAYLTDGTYTYNLYQDGTRIAQGLNQTSYNATLNNNASNLFVVKTNYYGGETNNSNRVGLAKGNASLVTLSLADNDQMTVLENSTLTVSGALSNGNADHLILENGAQLVNNSTGVNATVKKNITAYTEGQNDGWHLIASPITQDIIPSADNGLVVNNFDLYKFDQSGDGEGNEWLNYESDSHPFTTIENKTGYLYANSGNPTLSFAGALVANATATTLTYDANATQKGFNLIGNPYPCNAYVTRSFYVLHETDNGSEFTLGSGAIPPCSAILVQAQGAGESVSFSKTAPRIEPNIAISVTQANTRDNAFIDKAKISFNENDQLSKYSLNEQHSKIYIPQNGQDFAVACANGLPEMPVNFKATRNGTYTLKIEIESLELDYLHLIDNLTGNDVDLLVTPSYTFEANTTDYASRFRLMFSPIEVEENGTSFAYYADGEIIINANVANNAAHLQIVDMMGRVIVEKNATNRVSASELPLGVYVIRLIDGYQTLTQKLVIH